MKIRYFLYVFFLFFTTIHLKAQMPTDGDYTFWNWEDQSVDNWKRKNGSIWININPPFSKITDKTDFLYQIFQTGDYTKQKGWRIIYAQFDGTYPYFILYNIYKSVIRAFVYNESEYPSTYLMFSLTLQNNSVKLLGGNCPASATEVEDNTTNANIFTSVANFPGLNTWSVFEVPILFDDRLREHSIFPLMWNFSFARYNEFNIKLNLNGTIKSINPNGSNFIGSNEALNNSSNTFEAKYTKYQKKIQDIDKLLENMHQMADKISEKSPSFLQDYKGAIKGLKGATDVVHAISSLSSAAGALFGVFNFFSSAISGKNSATAIAYNFNGSLQGNMTSYSNIRANTLQVPATGNMDNYKWTPFNCPMGILNLQKTPTIKVTEAYQRYGIHAGKTSITYPHNTPETFWGNGGSSTIYVAGGAHDISPNHNEQHSGKYRKYKFDEDISLVKQEIEGLTLRDVKFALICKPIGLGKQKYKITSRFLTYHYFYDIYGYRHELPQENLVYTKLIEKQYIVHRFDEENDEVLYGTPYIPMNQFRGVTIEVPEDTEVSLGVMATFDCTEFDAPILFKAIYKLNSHNVGKPESYMGSTWLSTKNGFIAWMEPSFFPDSEYYYTDRHTLSSGPDSNTYVGKSITLLPGFHGINGFHAIAKNYKGVGNTAINSKNYNCNSLLNKVAFNNLITSVTNENMFEKELNIYPNPLRSDKILHISINDEIKLLQIYDIYGNLVYRKNNIKLTNFELELSFLSSGIYLMIVESGRSKHTSKIVIN